jgi:DUF4097 and DUF4098 domain-containing protein YvlB
MVSTVAFAADSQFERTLSVSAQPDLYVSTGSGDITIHPGEGSAVRIVGHVHAGWAMFGDVQSRIQRVVANPPIVQEGNAIHIGETHDHELYNNISIDYDIAVPADVALNLHSGSGDIKTSQVGRFLTAATGSGNIEAYGPHGTVDVGAGSGDITLELEGSGDVKARTGSGNIHIKGLNGGLTARTGSGNLDAKGRLSGPANLASGSGDIKLHLTQDAHFNLEASTGSGDIRVGFPGAPVQDEHSKHHMTAPINGGGAPLEVRTGSGNIQIDGGGDRSSADSNSVRAVGTTDCVANPGAAGCITK